MSSRSVAQALPQPVKGTVRRVARWTAAVRRTRAWPAVRPLARFARRFVDLDRVLGRPPRDVDRSEVAKVRRRLLNLGFTERALADLRTLAGDQTRPYRAQLAAWELALWHADQESPAEAPQALAYLRQLAAGNPDPRWRRQIAVVAAECRQRTGERDQARRVLSRALAPGGDPDLFLASANLAADPADRVGWFNRALAHHQLARVALTHGPGDGVLDRLRADPPPLDISDGPLVSVIVPVHDSAGTVGTALESVLSQTWRQIEVLVVDDASADHTVEVVEAYAARDRRVRLIRMPENQGTYVARNLGLRQARGEFVTCHDADDWSHPQKLERQLAHLIAEPDVVANTSEQARATGDLRFHRRGKPGYFLSANLSSLLFRREPVIRRLGFWDCVRFGADTELQRRMKRAFGAPAVVDLPTGPVSLQRQADGSLTSSAVFGYHGYFMGARKEYFETYTSYHRDGDLRYEFPQRRRPFPVPAPMLPRRPAGRRHFDVVIASDFRMVGGSTISSMEEIRAQQRLGLRTGLVQMDFYEADPHRPITPAVRELVDGDRVQRLVHGERISCDLLILRYPPVLQQWQRFLPEVTAGDIRVIVNQPPMRDYGPEQVRRYEIPRCHSHLVRHFGRSGIWHPIGPLVRQALHQHHAAELAAVELSDEDWVNIIDVEAWRRPGRPPRTSGRPVRIGRHSRDHLVKWPHDAEDLRRAYPDAPGYEIHVLGGARIPEQVLGGLPGNWRVHQFGGLTPAEFLAGIDVFVYFPNPYWVEAFGRVILEAMAAGVPVVLPEQFRPLFGDAALYTTPRGVRELVDALMADDDLYTARVDAAQLFVEKGFGHSRHTERVGRLLGR